MSKLRQAASSVLTGQCLQPAAPLQHRAAPQALSWQLCSPAPLGTSSWCPWHQSGHRAELCQSCPAFLKAKGWKTSLGLLNAGISTHSLLFATFTCGSLYWCLSCSTASTSVCRANPQLSTAQSPGWPSFWGAVHDPSLNPLFALSCSYSTCRTAWVFQEKKHTTSHY